MVITSQFQCEGYDAGQRSAKGIPDQIPFYRLMTPGENSDARLERVLEYVRSRNLDPTRWVIVRNGGENAAHYLKYCRDDIRKEPHQTKSSKDNNRRVYYIIDAPDHHIQPSNPQVEVVNDYNIIRGVAPFIRHRY
jgi:hypothetical protein